MNDTRAIDVPCPRCSVEAGVPCIAGAFCVDRIKAAAKRTRDANRAARREQR